MNKNWETRWGGKSEVLRLGPGLELEVSVSINTGNISVMIFDKHRVEGHFKNLDEAKRSAEEWAKTILTQALENLGD